jgi:hypothetical protein
MNPPSPTLEGFRAIFRRPSFGLAEIAWRWSFGAAAGVLLAFSFVEYLDTLPVSKADLLLLRTHQPILITRAVLHVFRGSAFRVIETAVVLLLTLGAAWIVVASLARAATVRALIARFRDGDLSSAEHSETKNWRLRSLFGLNFFRLGTTLAAAVGCLAAILLGKAVSRATDPAPGGALLITMTITLLVWLAWSTLNWFLSLAAIFAVAEGRETLGAIAAAVDLCRTRPGSVFAASLWFGLAHVTAFVIASSMLAFPLGFAAVFPAGVVLGGVMLVILFYFAVTDFLYAGRLAAYVAIVKLPESPVSADSASPLWPSTDTYLDRRIPPSPAIDASELILSDVSASS